MTSRIIFFALFPLSILGIHVTRNGIANVSTSVIQKDSTYSTTGLFDAGVQPQLISKQFEFTEGPATDKNGNVFFTDQPNNTIWKYSTDGKLTLFTDSSGRSNGMYFDKKGNLFTCADDKNQIWRFTANGNKHEIILRDLDGHKFNGPNDLWIDGKGGIYFTDPYYQRDYWTRKQTELDGQKVYYLPKGKAQPIIVTDKLQKPNGIAGTPDGKYLYAADIKANKIYKFTIEKDASLTNQQLFTDRGADGITLDEMGNVYLTGGNGVTIFNPQGVKIGLVAIPEPWTANVCFGGKNSDLLFITASKAVYTMQMKVKGSTKNASKQR